jgi:methyl-accepting chemotaxis protein
MLRRFRIGTRLSIGFSISLFALVIALFANNYLNVQNRDSLIAGLNAANDKVELVNKLKFLSLEIGTSIRDIGISSNVAEMSAEKDIITKKEKESAAAYSKLLSTALTSEEKKAVEHISNNDAVVAKYTKEAMDSALAFNTEGAAKIITENVRPISKNTLEQLDFLITTEKYSAYQIQKQVIKVSEEQSILSTIVGIVVTILGIASALVLTRSITNPLKAAVLVAQRVASGELLSNIETKGSDEITDLMFALQDMDHSLCNIVKEVRNSTQEITVAAKEIATGNSDLSYRTEQQASSLEETASAMEELTSTVKKNADSAKHANQLVIETANLATKGSEAVSSVVTTMNAIKDSSQKITDIITVIDSIAFQTNILALNAAVEAARAGSQGRGFAVVAQEVRNLSKRSEEAAKEIKVLITDSVGKIDNGSQLVNQAGSTMENMVKSVRKVTSIMDEISTASHEQSTGIDEINKAISRIDDVTQQNAALVEQAAAAAESMQEQADYLTKSVSVFKLGDLNEAVFE